MDTQQISVSHYSERPVEKFIFLIRQSERQQGCSRNTFNQVGRISEKVIIVKHKVCDAKTLPQRCK